MISPAVEAAMAELAAIGVIIVDADGCGDHVAFLFAARSRDGLEAFGCYRAQAVREQVIDGKLINPHGVRQDVHEILARHDLVTDWLNPGQVVVYNDPDAAGMQHSFYARKTDWGTDQGPTRPN
jgi:hypothetical protein